MELLEEAHGRIQQAVGILKSRTTNVPNFQPVVHSGKAVRILSPIADTSGSESRDTTQFANGTTYPKTPYPVIQPMDNSTEPQFASTPVLMDSQNLPMLITPCAIRFSESELTVCHSGSTQLERSTGTRVGSHHQMKISPTEGKQPGSADNSPGLPENRSHASQDAEDSLTQLESNTGEWFHVNVVLWHSYSVL